MSDRFAIRLRAAFLALFLFIGRPAHATGSETLNQLQPRGAPVSTDLIPILPVGSTVLKSVTVAQLQAYIASLGGGVSSVICGTGMAGGTITSTGECDLLPASPTTIGGVESLAAVAHNYLTSITTLGVPVAARPACADLSDMAPSCNTDTTNAANITSGNLAIARFAGGSGASSSTCWRGNATWGACTGSGGTVNGVTAGTGLTGGTITTTGTIGLAFPSATTIGGVESLAASAHNYLTSITTLGVPVAARPACADLSDMAPSCNTDATNASNIASGTLASARLPAMAAHTLWGNNTGSTAAPSALSAAQVVAMLAGTTSGTFAAGNDSRFGGPTQDSQSGSYTLALTDAGGQIYHPSADTTARTWTIPANASVAFAIGAKIDLVNDCGAGAVTIAITSDTLVWFTSGSTGSRTLSACGEATLTKIGATRWIVTGAGLS
jgi:hypothetical protein